MTVRVVGATDLNGREDTRYIECGAPSVLQNVQADGTVSVDCIG